jgi:hypothetical protein
LQPVIDRLDKESKKRWLKAAEGERFIRIEQARLKYGEHPDATLNALMDYGPGASATNWKREREAIAQEFRQVADQLENGGGFSNDGVRPSPQAGEATFRLHSELWDHRLIRGATAA